MATFAVTHAALTQLDWPELCEHVVSHCAGELAREFWRAPRFFEDRTTVEQALRLSGEALRLLEQSETPPLSGLYDLRQHLARLERQASLEAPELLEVAATLGCIRRMRHFLSDRAETTPGLAALAEAMVPHRDLEESIEEAFDETGNLTDNASPELGQLRRQVLALHETITDRMEQLVHELDRQGHLQDNWYTLRQERYVVPLRAGAKGQVKGIVHDVSGSGQTFFVEPEHMVEYNNRLRIAQLEVREEERRILARISGWVTEVLGDLRSSLELLNGFDQIFAGATLALELGGTVPEISTGEILLRQARHPLLALRPGRVVANDLVLEQRGRVLVISGPNTGGKTVTLKMMGQFSLMVRVGLPLPVAPGARFPLFSNVFCDIGDQQSIARSLSTFSAHLTNLGSFLPRVDEGSLVLLDELVVGTDPREGEALASAILRYLAERGAWTFVTTHYEALKALALEDPRVTNASMGFDPQTFAPTYQLFLGQPGRSSPLEIASRLGLPESILTAARALLPQENLHLEQAIRSLESARTELTREREELTRARREAAEASRAAAIEKEGWLRRRRILVQEGQDETLVALRGARAELAAAVRSLQRGADHETIQRLRRKVEAIGGQVLQLGHAGQDPDRPERALPRLESEAIRTGLAVRLVDRGLQGVIEAVDPVREEAMVRAGALRIVVHFDELRAAAGDARGGRPGSEPQPTAPRNAERTVEAGGPRRSKRVPAPTGSADEHLMQMPGIVCDLRGQRVDEAVAELERFMDKSFSRRHPYIFLIHGHGTGALKQAIREFLEASPYVRSWRPGVRGEGGDGVSVAWLDRA